jgi:type IV pilus assembly protein PilM
VGDKKVIGIDLGRESLKCVVLSAEKETVRIEACHSRKLALPVDADESAWRSAALAVLKEWRDSDVIGEDTVVVSAPSAHTLVRALKLPTSELPSKLAEEAKQQLPFPLETLDWDYAVVSEEGDQSHLSLAAIKKEIVEDILSLMQESGITPAAIDNGAMGLANVMLHADGGSCETPAAVLSLGATASNLSIVDGTKVWMRTLPVTGISVVTSLAKTLSVSEEEARTKLTSDVNLAAPAGGEETPATKNVRAAITRLVMEITRSLTFYRSQLNGEKPQVLYVTGGYSTIPGLCAFLSERLKMDVKPFEVFRNIEGAPAENTFLYGEALGVALSGAGQARYVLNLLPKDVQWQREFDTKKPLLIAASFLLAALFGVLCVLAFLGKGEVGSQSTAAEAALDTAKKYDGQIKKIQNEHKKQFSENTSLARILWERDMYVYLLREITKVMPTNMWFDGLETVTFGTIYETAIMDMEDSGFGRIEDKDLLARPVQVVLSGGYYGDWDAKMPEFETTLKQIPGIAGFKQTGSKTMKKYILFNLALQLDSNNDGKSDLEEINEEVRRPTSRRGR